MFLLLSFCVAVIALLLLVFTNAGVATLERLRPAGEIELLPEPELLTELGLIWPEGRRADYVRLQSNVQLVLRMLTAVKNDEVACIPVSKRVMQKRSHTMVLPEAAAFATPSRTGALLGDAVLGDYATIQQQNPLLEIIKQKHDESVQLLTLSELDLDRAGRFRSRFGKLARPVLNSFADWKNELIAACSAQRHRLRSIAPTLASYDFIDESSHDRRGTLPAYRDGSDPVPMGKQEFSVLKTK